MPTPLVPFARSLETAPDRLQNLGHHGMTGRMPHPGQLKGKLPSRFRRPPQRRHRIPAAFRLDQPVESLDDLRIGLLKFLTASAWRPDPASRRRRRVRSLLHPTFDRVPGRTCRPGNGRNSTMPPRIRLRAHRSRNEITCAFRTLHRPVTCDDALDRVFVTSLRPHSDPPLPLVQMGPLLLQAPPHRDKLRRTIVHHGHNRTEAITRESQTQIK